MNRTKTWAALALSFTILAACSESPTASKTDVARPSFDGNGNGNDGGNAGNGPGTNGNDSFVPPSNIQVSFSDPTITVSWEGAVDQRYHAKLQCGTAPFNSAGLPIGAGVCPRGWAPDSPLDHSTSPTSFTIGGTVGQPIGDVWACVSNQSGNIRWICTQVQGPPPPPTCDSPNHLVNGVCTPCELPNHWTPGAGDTWTCSPPTQQEKSQNATLEGGSMVYGSGPLSFTKTLSLSDNSDPRGVEFSVADGATGGCSIASTSGHSVTVTFTGVGSCTILALMNDTIYFNSTTLENDHWSITGADAEFSVTPADLTITASSHTLTYGAAVPTVTAGFSGFAYDDDASDLSSAAVCTTDYTQGSSVSGSPYATSCSGAAAANYNISYVAGSVTVNPAALTITASSHTVTYGDAVPTITAGYAGFVLSDNAGSLTTAPTCSTDYLLGSPAGGSYSTSCTGAASNGNYTISYVAGTVTVKQAPLVITAQSFTIWNYQPIPTCVMSFATFVNGDTQANLPGLNCPTPAGAGLGVYNPNGATNTNYAISYVKGNLSILMCALSQGYWKNHASEWAGKPLVSLFGRTTQSTWLTLWNTSVNGNGYMQLAYQFGAAYLNRTVKGSSWNPATQAATEAAFNAAAAIVSAPMPVAPTKPAKNASAAEVAAYNAALAAYTAGSNNAFAIAAVLEAWNAQAPSHCAGTI